MTTSFIINSIILQATQVRLIGRKLEGSLLSPFLKILDTFAVFQIFGKLIVSSEVLKIMAKALQTMSHRDFKTN